MAEFKSENVGPVLGAGFSRRRRIANVRVVAWQDDRADLLADAQLADAVRQGWLRPPLLQTADPPPRAAVGKLADLLRELAVDRSDR